MTKFLIFLSRLIFVGFFAGMTSNVSAETQWYTVELIIFSVLSPTINSESWPREPGTPSLEGSIELLAALDLIEDRELGGVTAFKSLNKGEFNLHKEWTRLKRSSGYRPLLHVAWRQPGFSKTESRPVHVTNHQQFRLVDTKMAEHQSFENPVPRTAFSAEPEAPMSPQVDGTIRVWRERYLHVEADLLYGATSTVGGSLEANSNSPTTRSARDHVYFRLTEKRHMRSRKLHYLDHPMFGMLVEITPFKDPVAAPPTAGVPGIAKQPIPFKPSPTN